MAHETAGPTYLAVGRIKRPHGLNGEVQVEVLTDHPGARFAPGSVLLLGGDPNRGRPLVSNEVLTVRPHGDRLLVRFASADSRESADQLRGQSVWIPAEEAAELEAGHYYAHQLVGMRVETVDGAELGTVREIMETGATDVLVVRSAETGKDVLLPMRAEVLVEIDLEARRIRVEPMPGLLD